MSNELAKIKQNIKNAEKEKDQKEYEEKMRKHRYYYNCSKLVDEYMPKITAKAVRYFETYPESSVRIIATESVVIKESIAKYLDALGIDYTVGRGYIDRVPNGDGYHNETYSDIFCDHCFYLESLDINNTVSNKDIFIKFNNILHVTHYDYSGKDSIYFERYCDEHVSDSGGSWGIVSIMFILVMVVIGIAHQA